MDSWLEIYIVVTIIPVGTPLPNIARHSVLRYSLRNCDRYLDLDATCESASASGSIPRSIMPCPRDRCWRPIGLSEGSRIWISSVVRGWSLVLSPEPWMMRWLKNNTLSASAGQGVPPQRDIVPWANGNRPYGI